VDGARGRRPLIEVDRVEVADATPTAARDRRRSVGDAHRDDEVTEGHHGSERDHGHDVAEPRQDVVGGLEVARRSRVDCRHLLRRGGVDGDQRIGVDRNAPVHDHTEEVDGGADPQHGEADDGAVHVRARADGDERGAGGEHGEPFGHRLGEQRAGAERDEQQPERAHLHARGVARSRRKRDADDEPDGECDQCHRALTVVPHN
jgi:hypothetical protein